MGIRIRLILLGLTVLLVSHAGSSRRIAGGAYYKGKIYVPYAGVPELLQLRKRAVLMDRTKFEALLKKAKRAGVENPDLAVIEQSDIAATVKGKLTLIEGTLRIRCIGNRPVAIALPFAGFALDGIKLGNEPAPLNIDRSGLPIVILPGKGVHTLKWNGVVQLTELRRGGQQFGFSTPPAVAGHLTLIAPGDQEILPSVPMLGHSYDKATDSTTAKLVIGKVGAVSVALLGNGRRDDAKAILVGQSATTIRIEPDGESLDCRYVVNVLRRSTRQLSFRVPKGWNIISVQCPGLVSWRLAADGKLNLRLQSAEKGSKPVFIRALRTTTKPAAGQVDWSAPKLELVDADANRGYLLVVPGAHWNIRGEKLAFARREDIQNAGSIPGLIAAKVGRLYLYWGGAAPWSISLTLSPVTLKRECEARQLARIGRQEVTLHSQLKVTPLGRELFEIAVQLPPDTKTWEFQTLRVNGLSTGFNHRIDANGRLVIELHRPIAVEAVCRIDVGLRLNADWEKTLATGNAAVRFPIIHCEAEKVDGIVSVSATSDLQVDCNFDLDGSKAVRTGELAALGLGRDVVAAYRYAKTRGGAIDATVRQRRARVSADSSALVVVGTEAVIGRFQTSYEINRAGIKGLYVLVDKSLGQAWKISLSNAVLQSRTVMKPGKDTVELSADIAAKYALWRIVLDETTIGKIGYDAAYRIPLLAKDGKQVALRKLTAPLIRPIGVDKISESLALQGNQQLKVTLAAKAAKAVDPAELVSRMLQGRRILSAYRFTSAPTAAEEQPSFELTIARQPQCELPSAIVEKVNLVSYIDADRSQQTKASISFRNNGRSSFEFKLPESVQLLSASVAGQQSKPQTTGKKGEYRLSLPKQVQHVAIELVYRVARTNAGKISVVAPVIMDMDVHGVQWTVIPPAGKRISSYDSKLSCREAKDNRPDPLSLLTSIFTLPSCGMVLKSEAKVSRLSKDMQGMDNEAGAAATGKGLEIEMDAKKKDAPRPPRKRAAEKKSAPARRKPKADNVVREEDSLVDVSDEAPATDDNDDSSKIFDVTRQHSPLRFTKNLRAGRYTLPVGLVGATNSGRTLQCSGTGQPELRVSLGREYSRSGIFAVGFGLVLVIWTVLFGRPEKRMQFVCVTLAGALALRILNIFLVDLAAGAMVSAALMGVCEGIARIIRRRRAAKAAALALVVLSLISVQTVSAQEGLIVPYNGDAKDPKASGKVLVPYSRFMELWRKANPNEAVAAPLRGTELTLSDVQYLLKRGKEKRLELQLAMNVRTTGKGDVMLPMPFTGVAITKATLDGAKAPLRMGPRGMVLVLKPKTQGRVVITGQLTAVETGSRGSVRLMLPPLPAPMMTVDLADKGLDLEAMRVSMRNMNNAKQSSSIPSTIEQLLTRRENGSRWKLALGMHRDLILKWRPKAGEGAADRTLVAETSHDVYYFHWGIVGRTTVKYGFAGGKRDRFEVYVPTGYKVTTLTGPNLRDQRAGNKMKLDNRGFTAIGVRLHRAAERSYTLTMGWMAPLPKTGQTTRLFLPRAGRVATEKGRLSLHTAGGVRLRTAELTGGRRIGRTSDINRRQPADGAAQLVRYFWAYRPFSLKLLMSREVTTKKVALSQLVRVGWDGVQLLAQCEETAETGLLYGSSFRLPQGYDVLNVSGAQVDAWHVQRVGNDQHLHVAYRQAVTSAKLVAVMVRQNFGVGRLPVPSIVGIAPNGSVIPTQTGRLAVQLIDSFEATTAQSNGLTPTPPRELSGWLSHQQLRTVQFAYRHNKPSFKLALDVKVRPTRIEAETMVGLAVQPNSVNYTYLLRNRVVGSPIDKITFTMPADLADRAVVNAIAKRSIQREAIEGKRVRWTVSLLNEVTGLVDVTVNFSLPIGAKTDRLRIPVIAVDGPKTNHTIVAVQNMSRHDLKIEQDGLREMPMQERAKLLGNQVEALQFAYHTFDAKWSATLKLSQAKDVSRIPIIIDLMAITTVVDASGNVFSKVRLSLDNRSKQFLEVNLPKGAKLLGVRVAGRGVKPLKPKNANANAILVPLSIMSLNGQPFDVELWLHDGTAPVKALGRVRPPRLKIMNVPVTRTTWTLRLPNRFRYMRAKGNMSPILGTAEVMTINTEAKIGQLQRGLKGISSGNLQERDLAKARLVSQDLSLELARNKSYLEKNRYNLKAKDYNRLMGAWQQQALTAAKATKTIEGEAKKGKKTDKDLNWYFNDIADNGGLAEAKRNQALNEMPDFVKKADTALIANIKRELNRGQARKDRLVQQAQQAANQPVQAESIFGEKEKEAKKEVQELVQNMDMELQSRQNKLVKIRDKQLLLQSQNVMGGRAGRYYRRASESKRSKSVEKRSETKWETSSKKEHRQTNRRESEKDGSRFSGNLERKLTKSLSSRRNVAIDGWLAQYQRVNANATHEMTMELPSLDTVQLDFAYPGGEPELSVLAVPVKWFSFGRRLIIVLVLSGVISGLAYALKKRREKAAA